LDESFSLPMLTALFVTGELANILIADDEESRVLGDGRRNRRFDAIVTGSRRTARSYAWCTRMSRVCSRKASKGLMWATGCA
jgi:hypothetical protein